MAINSALSNRKMPEAIAKTTKRPRALCTILLALTTHRAEPTRIMATTQKTRVAIKKPPGFSDVQKYFHRQSASASQDLRVRLLAISLAPAALTRMMMFSEKDVEIASFSENIIIPFTRRSCADSRGRRRRL